MSRVATLIEVKDYFGCPGREVTPAEMKMFWEGMSPEEKLFYKEGVGAILEAQQA